ncbi:hypothetical protein B4135_1746 [Caldibacillus debilis]|uniref:Uncharacterized protein n=1 Tax=Caldibacillus debilis TaxID=301148 RepID=A0A150M9Q0_9BACI|nr:hypothetical protein B4135_1746 [Caldibacillus debilis]
MRGVFIYPKRRGCGEISIRLLNRVFISIYSYLLEVLDDHF